MKRVKSLPCRPLQFDVLRHRIGRIDDQQPIPFHHRRRRSHKCIGIGDMLDHINRRHHRELRRIHLGGELLDRPRKHIQSKLPPGILRRLRRQFHPPRLPPQPLQHRREIATPTPDIQRTLLLHQPGNLRHRSLIHPHDPIKFLFIGSQKEVIISAVQFPQSLIIQSRRIKEQPAGGASAQRKCPRIALLGISRRMKHRAAGLAAHGTGQDI